MLEEVKANPVFFRRVLDHQRGAQTGPGLDLGSAYSQGDPEDSQYLRGAFRAAMGNMVGRWLDHGCDLPVDHLVRLILTLFPWR